MLFNECYSVNAIWQIRMRSIEHKSIDSVEQGPVPTGLPLSNSSGKLIRAKDAVPLESTLTAHLNHEIKLS